MFDRSDWAAGCFDIAGSMLVVIDVDGRVRRVNRMAAELLGWPQQDIIGKDWLGTFVPEHVRDDVRRVFTDLADDEGKGPERFENPVLCRDGTERLVSWHNAVLRDGAGHVAAVLSSGDDVTERQRVAAALRESERRFRATFEQAAVGMAHVAPDGRFLRVNAKLCEITGHSESELLTLTFPEITHPDDLDADLGLAAALFAGRIPNYSMEKRYVRKDGAIVWANLTGSVVWRDDGEPDYAIAVVEDITARRQVEDLRRSEERLRLAMEAGRIGVWDLDVGTGRVTWSDDFAPFIGPAAGNVAGTLADFRSLVHPDDRPWLEEAMRQALAGAGEYSTEFRLTGAGGTTHWIASRGTVLRDGAGRAVRMIGVDVDVTARREVEDRHRLLAAEYDHRVKNILALVRAIASQSLTSGDERTAYLGRLAALTRAHGLLTTTRWQSVGIDQLVHQELAAFAGDRVGIRGEPVPLASRTAQTFVLVLHELVTNAAKYGALSAEGGRLDVEWSVEAGDPVETKNGAVLDFAWTERGGPPVVAPLREGFGWKLIRTSIELGLDGTVAPEFGTSGLSTRFRVPLSRISPATAAGAGDDVPDAHPLTPP